MSMVLNLHSGRQTFDYDCGAKSLQLVMAYYGIELREDELIARLGSGRDGTRVEHMIEVAVAAGFKVIAREHWPLCDIKGYIDQGHPVIVLLQAWAETKLTIREWLKNFNDGHYAILIGYDRGVMLFEDPASFRRTWLRESEFLARWHDLDPVHNHIYKRFGMVLLGREPESQSPLHMD